MNFVDIDKFRWDVVVFVLCNIVGVDFEDLLVGEIDNFVREYNLILKNIMDYYVLLKIKVFWVRLFVFWYSVEIYVVKRCCCKVERVWRKSKLEVSFKLFKILRNYVIYLINKVWIEYYIDFINKNSDN